MITYHRWKALVQEQSLEEFFSEIRAPIPTKFPWFKILELVRIKIWFFRCKAFKLLKVAFVMESSNDKPVAGDATTSKPSL